MKPVVVNSMLNARDRIFAEVGRHLKVGTPLGLGKPIPLLNLLYEETIRDPNRRLEIHTALTLSVPTAKSELEKRFLEPFKARHFGSDYPALAYATDLSRERLPANVRVHEFYMQAGQYTHNTQAQSSYTSLNYTHVARSLVDRGINVIVQLVAKDPARKDPRYSLSCNPDVTLDVVDLCKQRGQQIFRVGVVHPDLPYLGGDAKVDPDFFDVIVDEPIDSPDARHPLFALPKSAIAPADHMIGLYASQLIVDGGTLQIGIGSLSDALVHATLMRHQKNVLYRDLARLAQEHKKNRACTRLQDGPFEVGLYGTSEMLMDGFMHLRKAGILKRTIFDQDEKCSRYLHAAFFLGSKDLYAWLRSIEGEDYEGLSMTRVSKVNDLYDPNELALRRQRREARFFNTCMNVTLLGAAASDTLGTGEVVSGVGGQYNFVAMSHELPDASSVLMLRSWRQKNGKRISNIVTGHPQLTIPRHLRDIVVTEYGIAWLHAKTDQEVVEELIRITDAEFQDELVDWAKAHKKLDPSYEVPPEARLNTPEHLNRFVKTHAAHFPEYPFGSDFTPAELKLLKGLNQLKDAKTPELIRLLVKGIATHSGHFKDELERMKLKDSTGPKEWCYRRLVLGALATN